MEFAQLAERLRGAETPEDVFGLLSGARTAQEVALKRVYRQLVRLAHPDVHINGQHALAVETFNALRDWHTHAQFKITQGTYGDRTAPYEEADKYAPVEISVKRRRVTLTGVMAEGTFSRVHSAKHEDDTERRVFAKVARDPADNDLLEREFRTLRKLQEEDPVPEKEKFFQGQRNYVPFPVASFFLAGNGGERYRANLLTVPEHRSFTAEELLQAKFSSGIEPKHVYWIFRRLLLTLWMAHLKGVAHGAVTPDHVLVYPEEHGIVLLGWTCSSEINSQHVLAINPKYRAFYPPEVFEKKPATPALDIYMAAMTVVRMFGGDPAARRLPASVPQPIANDVLRCLEKDPRRRPQDAEVYHNEFGRVLERLHGRRKYAEFIVP